MGQAISVNAIASRDSWKWCCDVFIPGTRVDVTSVFHKHQVLPELQETVKSSANALRSRGTSEDSNFNVNGSADAQEFEALVGGGEGVGAIGEVSNGLEEGRPDEPAPPPSFRCLARTILLVELRRVLNYVKNGVVAAYFEWR